MELSSEMILPWALSSLLSSPTTWETRTLGPRTCQSSFTKGVTGVTFMCIRGLTAPLKKWIKFPLQSHCAGFAKPTSRREMPILVCGRQRHPSAIFQGWWPPNNIEVAGQSSEVYVEGALSPEHLRLLGAACAWRVCRGNGETMRKTNAKKRGDPQVTATCPFC